MLDSTVQQLTPVVQTCPDGQGAGEFVTGPYSRTCGECHGEGVRVVTATCDACGDDYPAGSGALFRFWSGKADDLLCPGCTAEALTDPENYTRVGDEPTPAPAANPDPFAGLDDEFAGLDAATIAATLRTEAHERRAYVGPRALDARTGDLLVWRSGAYMPAAERDYYAGCKRGLARVAA